MNSYSQLLNSYSQLLKNSYFGRAVEKELLIAIHSCEERFTAVQKELLEKSCLWRAVNRYSGALNSDSELFQKSSFVRAVEQLFTAVQK